MLRASPCEFVSFLSIKGGFFLHPQRAFFSKADVKIIKREQLRISTRKVLNATPEKPLSIIKPTITFKWQEKVNERWRSRLIFTPVHSFLTHFKFELTSQIPQPDICPKNSLVYSQLDAVQTAAFLTWHIFCGYLFHFRTYLRFALRTSLCKRRRRARLMTSFSLFFFFLFLSHFNLLLHYSKRIHFDRNRFVFRIFKSEFVFQLFQFAPWLSLIPITRSCHFASLLSGREKNCFMHTCILQVDLFPRFFRGTFKFVVRLIIT